jgi:1,4-dihydroxy-6-naphthoate synthase
MSCPPVSKIVSRASSRHRPVSLTLGHSPDADDAFMFCALAEKAIPTEGLEFEHLLQDIETLNRRAERSELDITALSAHAYAFLTDRYILLNSGASMGQGYGPIVVSKKKMTAKDLPSACVAVPGERTSAFLALRLFARNIPYVVAPFDQILEMVARDQVDAGLLIHEGQLTYMDYGLSLVLDLGTWWFQETDGLPLPLGVNAIRRGLPVEVQKRADRVLKRSIQWGLENRGRALHHAAQWGRGIDASRMSRFVNLYVNDLTLHYGREGKKALRVFFESAGDAGLIPQGTEPEFV